MATFGDLSLSSSESEQDANSALMELDKGLRSGKMGEQCEAIVKFPGLFEKYPFPILINSAFLKLADVFRVGINFLRLWVLRVFQQSEKHLDKILNIDEFLRRIYMVIHSNDPVARSLTLRTLGSIAVIIPERKNAHHSILNGLDSHDSVEMGAAMYAASHFAAQSKTFCDSICGKLADKIKGLETPVETKLKLIEIFQHMHHDIQTASKIKKLCLQLLPDYPAKDFVITTLHTLTKLARHTLVDITDQTQRLLRYLSEDLRMCVKMAALKDLNSLAKAGPHMWKQEDVKTVLDMCFTTESTKLKRACLEVLTNLSSGAVMSFTSLHASELEAKCITLCYHANLDIAAKSCQLLSDVCVHNVESSSASEATKDFVCSVLESLILSSTIGQPHPSAAKICLKSAIKVCQVCPDRCCRFVQAVTSLLPSVDGECCQLLCEFLCAVGSLRGSAVHSVVCNLVSVMESCDDPKTKVLLSTVLFQASEYMSDTVTSSITNLCLSLNGWSLFKVARQAARYGHHGIAATMWIKVANQVWSEHLQSWLTALHQVCLAEERVMVNDLTQALTIYQQGITSLKAASSPSHQLHFQCEFVRLRVLFIKAHHQLQLVCRSFDTNPPPAIASSVAAVMQNDLYKCGHITAQLQECMLEFQEISALYGSLFQTLFDADAESLKAIQVHKECCNVMMKAIKKILQVKFDSSNDLAMFPSLPTDGTQEALEHVKRESSRSFAQACQMSAHFPLNYMHIECICKTSELLISQPLRFPRYFFQSLQQTSIKLAVSPQSKVSEPYTLERTTRLMLKVEGVIERGHRPGLYRDVKVIVVNVESVMLSGLPIAQDTKVSDCRTNAMSETVLPHNDYFTAQFLLHFPDPGIHNIKICTSIVDECGTTWRSPAGTSLTIKSYDEVARIQMHQQQAHHKSFILAQQKTGNVLT